MKPLKSVMNSSNELIKLFPVPSERVPLRGLYLSHDLHSLGSSSQPFVYSDFICSLDGRISLPDPVKDTHIVPGAITNPRDWRLFQELTAQADVLITSGRYIRQIAQNTAQDSLPVSEKQDYSDLIEWRKSQGLPAQPDIVILSDTLNFHLPEDLLNSGRRVYVAAGAGADSHRMKEIEKKGVSVIIAGRRSRVEGRRLITALGEKGYSTIDMVAGPQILHTLLADGMLNRLYLTRVPTILGGISFDTLTKGTKLIPPADFTLRSLYYDPDSAKENDQLFAVYEVKAAG
jgi:riboflavin biosynthesis pyrimidine reductase